MISVPRVVGVVAPLALLPGCLLWDDINEAPRPVITIEEIGASRIEEPRQYFIPRQYQLNCLKSSDPDGIRPSCAWTLTDRNGPRGGSNFDSVELDFHLLDGGVSHEPVTAMLTVTDRKGAKTTIQRVFEPTNQTSPIFIRDLPLNRLSFGSYTAGRRYEFFPDLRQSGDEQDKQHKRDQDGDELEFTWLDVVPPYDTDVDAGVGDSVAGRVPLTDHYFVRADAPGTWKLQVRGDDHEQNGQVFASFDMVVKPDEPPCITAVQPLARPPAQVILERGAAVVTFRVTAVADEMDIYPLPVPVPDGGVAEDPDLHEAHFRWYLGPADGSTPLAEIPAHNTSDMTIDPNGYPLGERLTLRVEAHDRKPRVYCDAPNLPANCEPPPRPGCQQRFDWLVEVR